MRAVIWSDVIQVTVLSGAILAAVAVAVHLVGGIEEVFTRIDPQRLRAVDFAHHGFGDGRTFAFWPIAGRFFNRNAKPPGQWSGCHHRIDCRFLRQSPALEVRSIHFLVMVECQKLNAASRRFDSLFQASVPARQWLQRLKEKKAVGAGKSVGLQ